MIQPPAVFESDTAQSLIRKLGFPPFRHTGHEPSSYLCPCCSNLSPRRRRSRSAAAAEERRRAVLQETVIEDRARARYPEPHVWPHSAHGGSHGAPNAAPPNAAPLPRTASLPPPPGIADVRAVGERRRWAVGGAATALRLTVHRGVAFDVPARSTLTVQAKFGRYVGETRPLTKKKKSMKWGEQFSLPICATDTHPLEVRVMQATESGVKCVGFATIANLRLFDPQQGRQVPIEIARGKLVLSWKVGEVSKEQTEQQVHADCEAQRTHVAVYIRTVDLKSPLPEASADVEFILRDAGGTCTPPVTISWDADRHAHDCSSVPTLTLPSTSRMISLLCVRRQDHQDTAIVVASSILDTLSLPPHSSAKVPLCAYPDGAPVGHVVLEWLLTSPQTSTPVAEDDARAAQDTSEAVSLEGSTLSVTVIRGINLADLQGNLLPEPSISVACGSLQADIPAVQRDGSDVLWNQEVRFDLAKSNIVECLVSQDGNVISSGEMTIDQQRGIRMVLVTALDRNGKKVECGHVLFKFRLQQSTEGAAAQQSGIAQQHLKQLELSALRLNRESPVHSGAEETLSSARTQRWPPAIETILSPNSASPRSVRSRDPSPPPNARTSVPRPTAVDIAAPRGVASPGGSPRGPSRPVERTPGTSQRPSHASPTDGGKSDASPKLTWSLRGARPSESIAEGMHPDGPSPKTRASAAMSPRSRPSETLLPEFEPRFDGPSADAHAASAPTPSRRKSAASVSAMAASLSEGHQSRRWRLPSKDAERSAATDGASGSISASPRDPYYPSPRKWSLREGDSSVSAREKWNSSTRVDEPPVTPSKDETPSKDQAEMKRSNSMVEKGQHAKIPRIFFRAAADGRIIFFREGDPIPTNKPADSDSMYGNIPSSWTDAESSLPKALEAEEQARLMLQEQLYITTATMSKKNRNFSQTTPWFPPGCSTLDIHFPYEKRALTKVSENAIRLMDSVAANIRSRSQKSLSASAGKQSVQ